MRVIVTVIQLLSLIGSAYGTDLNSLKVTDLKAILKQKGLPQTGIKAELIARLSQEELPEAVSEKKRAPGLMSRLKKVKTTIAPEDNAVAIPEMMPVPSEAVDMDELELLMLEGDRYLQQRNVVLPSNDIEAVRQRSSEASSVGASSGGSSIKDRIHDEILALMEERTLLRMDKDYPGADIVKDKLASMYGVEIFDRTGEWKDNNGRYGKFTTNTKAPKPVAVATSLTQEEIQRLVEKRTSLRRERRYDEADEVRDELARNGVELFDKLNQWECVVGNMKGLQSTDFY